MPDKYQPLISVIVPIYNVELYLNRCITSIVQQTYHNLEIILVDDGSNDRSCEICDMQKLKDNRIKVIHKKMVGCLMLEMLGYKSPTVNTSCLLTVTIILMIKCVKYC